MRPTAFNFLLITILLSGIFTYAISCESGEVICCCNHNLAASNISCKHSPVSSAAKSQKSSNLALISLINSHSKTNANSNSNFDIACSIYYMIKTGSIDYMNITGSIDYMNITGSIDYMDITGSTGYSIPTGLNTNLTVTTSESTCGLCICEGNSESGNQHKTISINIEKQKLSSRLYSIIRNNTEKNNSQFTTNTNEAYLCHSTSFPLRI